MQRCWILALALLTIAGSAPARDDASLREQVRKSLEKGCAWLTSQQNTNGYWSNPEYPALTALVLKSLIGASPDASAAPGVEKGFAFLASCVQPDGGIYSNGLESYNTSVVLSTLALRNRPEDRSIIQNARRYLIGLQVGDAQMGGTNSPFTGGIGYGASEKRPDLSNTAMVLEALYNSRQTVEDATGNKAPDLNWKAAIRFLQNCQNLPGTNTQPWVADDPQDRGGFTYAPGRSNAGQTNSSTGHVAYRSYGSMTYAGLLSYIYSDLKPDDPRVISALDWLRANFTVEENPALGQQGIYYYYGMMAKALTFAGVDTLETRDGQKINWRETLARKLISLQRPDGSWVNENGRWWEKNDVLDSAYSAATLEIIEPKL